MFHIRVHKITRRAKPVLTDEFAKAQGFEDASALRRSIMEQAVQNKQQEAADAYADALVQQVIEGMEADIPERMVSSQLDGLMHDLEQQLMQQGATMDAYLEMAGLTRDDLRRIARQATHFALPITGTCGFDQAQVTAGGLDTSEFDPHTLQSRLTPGLYACGELLDVDGDCGGYNLQWAWSSARLAGRLL